MPAIAPPERFNFARHLLEVNVSRASKLAYRDDERALTYGELADGVRRLAAVLPALGMRR